MWVPRCRLRPSNSNPNIPNPLFHRLQQGNLHGLRCRQPNNRVRLRCHRHRSHQAVNSTLLHNKPRRLLPLLRRR